MGLHNINEVSTPVAVMGFAAMFIVLWIVKSLYHNRHIFKFAKNYRGYPFYPVIGNGNVMFGKNIFIVVQDIIKKYGLPCNMWQGHDYNYITADAAELKVILNHPNTFDKMKLYDTFQFIFGKSLLLVPVDVWKRHRKFYSKSFSQPILNSFVQYFYKKSIILLDVLKDAHNRDLFEVFERYTFDSFCESIIGIDYNLQIDPKVPIVEWMGEAQAIGGRRLSNYFYLPTYLWVFSRDGRRTLHLVKQIRNFIFGIIKEKRRLFVENSVCTDSDTPLPLMDAMLQAEGEKFSDKHIFEEMFLFTTAATDTSGYTLAYTITLLGMHPEVQEKVYQEVMSEIGCDRPIYYDDLPNLKYTERAILEAMRLLPVTPLLGRKATENVDIGSKTIPKGANILICIFDLHRNSKYWKDPLKYDPDRFLPEEVAKREPYSYLPFSGGPRNCIGKTYALMLMKTAVANVVRNYEISSKYQSVSEFRLSSCITMKTLDPLDCRFKPRMHD